MKRVLVANREDLGVGVHPERLRTGRVNRSLRNQLGIPRPPDQRARSLRDVLDHDLGARRTAPHAARTNRRRARSRPGADAGFSSPSTTITMRPSPPPARRRERILETFEESLGRQLGARGGFLRKVDLARQSRWRPAPPATRKRPPDQRSAEHAEQIVGVPPGKQQARGHPSMAPQQGSERPLPPANRSIARRCRPCAGWSESPARLPRAIVLAAGVAAGGLGRPSDDCLPA